MSDSTLHLDMADAWLVGHDNSRDVSGEPTWRALALACARKGIWGLVWQIERGIRTYVSVCLVCLCVPIATCDMSVSLSFYIWLAGCPSIPVCLSICLSILVFLSVCLSVFLYLSVYLPIPVCLCLSVYTCLSFYTYLSVCLFFCMWELNVYIIVLEGNLIGGWGGVAGLH